ncbi:MAG TPA: hypothetical protein VHZ03_40680 [Trebonia sp.]|nr:hypothetical protein [Trebonia sp.]
MSVLAQIIADRDGTEQSASQAWRQALAHADHLAFPHAIWADQTTPARPRGALPPLLGSALPAGYGQQDSHQEHWLHRTLRAAELAGLDPGQVLAQAVAERDLTGVKIQPTLTRSRHSARSRSRTVIAGPAGLGGRR